MWFFLVILSLSLIGFFIHLYLTKEPVTSFRIVELLLLYQLVFSVGVASLLGFFGLAFMGKHVAEILGWPECPFQIELANVNLGYGVLGIMCIWFRKYFWLATVIGFSIWIFADGIHHFADFYLNNNEPLSQIPMITDFIVPGALVILTILYFRYMDVNQSKRVDP